MAPSPEEILCAAIVAAELGGRWRRLEATHDFDIELDGLVDHLEVCAFTEADVERQWAETPAPLGSNVLGGRWAMHVTRWCDVRAVQAAAEEHLSALERNGITTYIAGEHYVYLAQYGAQHPIFQASIALVQLGIEDAYVLDAARGQSGSIEVLRSVGGVGQPTLLVNGAVEERAWKVDNRAKLSSTTAHAKHLFVPFRVKAGVAWSAAASGPPTVAPNLPPEIDRVWVLAGTPQLLLADRGGPWRTVAIAPEVFANPRNWEVS